MAADEGDDRVNAPYLGRGDAVPGEVEWVVREGEGGRGEAVEDPGVGRPDGGDRSFGRDGGGRQGEVHPEAGAGVVGEGGSGAAGEGGEREEEEPGLGGTEVEEGGGDGAAPGLGDTGGGDEVDEGDMGEGELEDIAMEGAIRVLILLPSRSFFYFCFFSRVVVEDEHFSFIFFGWFGVEMR